MIQFVTYKAYCRIIEKCRADDLYLSGYDCQNLLKLIIWDLFQYLIHHFNPYAGIDYGDVAVIVRVTRPDTPRHVAFEWAEIVRRTMCEEFNIAYKGYLLSYEIDGEFVRVTTKKVMDSADDLY